MPKKSTVKIEESEAVSLPMVDQLREAFADALEPARSSEETTATRGWLDLYRAHGDELAKARRDLAASLSVLAESLQFAGWTEDDEKDVREIAKAHAAIRARELAFQSDTIDPVRAPVRECRRLVEKFLAQAAAAERDAPLHNRGLEEIMSEAVALLPLVEWESGSGQVVIRLGT